MAITQPREKRMEGRALELASLCGVRKQYGKVVALDGVDLSIAPGQVLALLGANGAGKTTAIALLLGLVRPDGGQALMLGQSPQQLAARRNVGVMLQSAGIADNSKVCELLELTRSYYRRPRSIDECVALAGLDGLLGRQYGKLSGGQQRRVQFALALCGNPRLLFLDEPTTGMDIEARQALWRAIRELAARVVGLARGGALAAGSMDEVRRHVAQRRIRCRSALDAADVAAWPQVRSARRTDARIEIVTDAAEAVVRRLLGEDAALSELEVQRAGLAEAFLELTRDDADAATANQREAA